MSLPRLHPDIEIIRLGPRQFVLHHKRHGEQFEIGADERYILHALSRATTLDGLLDDFRSKFRRELARERCLEFFEQLRRYRLLADGNDGRALATPVVAPELPTTPAPLPFSTTDPHSRLNFIFDLLVLGFGWIIHPVFIVPVVMLAVIAARIAFAHYDRYIGEMVAAVEHYPKLPFFTLELLQTMLLVNLPRAILGAMTVRRFGGRITAFGVRMLGYLIPTFYYEAYRSQAFKTDRGAWTILSVDVWIRMGMGSAVIICWYVSRPFTSQSLFWGGLIAAFVFGLFYHCVIFFEQSASYWLLCHAVDDSRIRERALAETAAWAGLRVSPEALTGDEQYWLRAYGIGFYLFRVIFDLSVLIITGRFLIGKFRSVGFLIFLTGILWAYRETLRRGIMNVESLHWLIRGGGDKWTRWVVRMVMLLAVISIGFIPYAHEIVGECRVIAGDSHGIRSRIDDEIAEVFVTEGDQVEPGTMIARLMGRKAKADVETTKAALDKSKADLDLLQNGYLPEDIAVAADQVAIDEANLKFADLELARVESLGAKGYLNTEDVDTWRRNSSVCRDTLAADREKLAKLKKGPRTEEIRAAQALVESNQVYYKHALAMSEETNVVSPTRGHIVTPYMKERRGQPVSVGDLIAVVQDKSRMHAEVAADSAASFVVQEGAPVKIRLYGTYGRLITGRVHTIAPGVESYGKFGNSSVNTNKEMNTDESSNSRYRDSSYQIRIYVDLDHVPEGLTTEMTGFARIHVGDDVLWRAVARPIARFLQVDVWSWLP